MMGGILRRWDRIKEVAVRIRDFMMGIDLMCQSLMADTKPRRDSSQDLMLGTDSGAAEAERSPPLLATTFPQTLHRRTRNKTVEILSPCRLCQIQNLMGVMWEEETGEGGEIALGVACTQRTTRWQRVPCLLEIWKRI